MSWKEALLIKKASISISTGLRVIFFPIKKRIFATILSFTQHVKVYYTKYAQFIISARRDISLCHRLLLWCFLFEVFGFLWWIRILNVIHFSIVAVCFGIKSAKCLWCLQFSALFTPPPLHISQKGKSIRCESSMFSIHHSFAVSSFFFSFFVPLGYFLYWCIISKDYCLDWLHDHQKKHFVLIIAIVIWL